MAACGNYQESESVFEWGRTPTVAKCQGCAEAGEYVRRAAYSLFFLAAANSSHGMTSLLENNPVHNQNTSRSERKSRPSSSTTALAWNFHASCAFDLGALCGRVWGREAHTAVSQRLHLSDDRTLELPTIVGVDNLRHIGPQPNSRAASGRS